MVRLIVPDHIRRHAREIAEPLEKRYSGNATSIRCGAGHYYAKIGELMACEYYFMKHVDDYHSDCVVVVNGVEKRIEVKVKQRSVEPRRHYYASVAAANATQKCDHYLFCSTIRDEVLFIIGFMPPRDFIINARKYKKGDLDPDAPPGQNWTFKADCYNAPYIILNQVGKVPLL